MPTRWTLVKRWVEDHQMKIEKSLRPTNEWVIEHLNTSRKIEFTKPSCPFPVSPTPVACSPVQMPLPSALRPRPSPPAPPPSSPSFSPSHHFPPPRAPTPFFTPVDLSPSTSSRSSSRSPAPVPATMPTPSHAPTPTPSAEAAPAPLPAIQGHDLKSSLVGFPPLTPPPLLRNQFGLLSQLTGIASPIVKPHLSWNTLATFFLAKKEEADAKVLALRQERRLRWKAADHGARLRAEVVELRRNARSMGRFQPNALFSF